MYVVALLGWTPGFVANRRVELLRAKLFTGRCVSAASQVAEGSQVAIAFPTLQKADDFTRSARALGVRLELRLPASAAG